MFLQFIFDISHLLFANQRDQVQTALIYHIFGFYVPYFSLNQISQPNVKFKKLVYLGS
jgi:hypothetical protein